VSKFKTDPIFEYARCFLRRRPHYFSPVPLRRLGEELFAVGVTARAMSRKQGFAVLLHPNGSRIDGVPFRVACAMGFQVEAKQ
jgi:hypothetical protein